MGPQPTVEGSYAGWLGPPPGIQTCAEQHKRPLAPQPATRQRTNLLPILATPPVTGDTRTVSTTVSSHRQRGLVPAGFIGSARFCAAVERRNQLGDGTT